MAIAAPRMRGLIPAEADMRYGRQQLLPACAGVIPIHRKIGRTSSLLPACAGVIPRTMNSVFR